VARVSARGVSVVTPPGWDVRIFRRDEVPPERTFTVVQAANFSLPATIGDYGNGAVQVMGPWCILLCLIEFAPEHVADALFRAPGPPPSLNSDEFRRSTLQHNRPGQVGTQRFFNAGGRAWSLYAIFGSEELRSTLVPVVNSVLAGITIGAES
jgi:hypothetical protein